MSGQLRKEDIVNQQEIQDAFASMAASVKPFIDNIKEAGEVAVALNEALKSGGGFKEIVKDSNKAAEKHEEVH